MDAVSLDGQGRGIGHELERRKQVRHRLGDAGLRQPETSSSIIRLTSPSSSTAPSTVKSRPRTHFIGCRPRKSEQNFTSSIFFPSYQEAASRPRTCFRACLPKYHTSIFKSRASRAASARRPASPKVSPSSRYSAYSSSRQAAASARQIRRPVF